MTDEHVPLLLTIIHSVADKYRKVDCGYTAAPLPDCLPAGHHLLPRGVREPRRARVHQEVPVLRTGGGEDQGRQAELPLGSLQCCLLQLCLHHPLPQTQG